MARQLTGAEGTFSFSGGNSVANVDVFEISEEYDVSGPFDTTPFSGYAMRRYTFGVLKGVRGTFRAYQTDAGKQAIPDGTVGTLVSGDKTSQTNTFKASVYAFAKVKNSSEDGPEINVYRFVCNAQANTDTIT